MVSKMRIGGIVALGLLILGVYFPWGELSKANAHCQIPCGIYDDDCVIKTLYVDIQTIEKSMKQIELLSKNPMKNQNQLIRWVLNKEKHADKFCEVIVEYFMQQRIKIPAGKADDKYQQKLMLCHKMLVTAMKCKQTTDTEQPHALKHQLEDFVKLYKQKK